MSLGTQDLVPTVDDPHRPHWRAQLERSAGARVLLAGLVLLVLLSLTRVLADADDLTSSSIATTTARLTVPILLAGLAGLWSERAGIVNIGIEGMMIFGTWFGALGAWQFGPWIGLLMGVLGGAAGGLVHAIATVRFNVDHVISGVAINLFALGAMRYASELVFVGEEGGGISQSPSRRAPIPAFNMPFLAGGELFGWRSPDLLGWIERRGWFLVADLAGLLRGVLVGLSWATLIAVALVAVSAFVLWRTRIGLRLRSSGEAPTAAESLGVRIVRIRYLGLLVSGGFAGLGGAYLSIVLSPYYRQGQTAGRGYIGLATMIFGNWRPLGVLGGSALFGYSDAVRVRDPESVPALFLFGTFVAGVMLIVSLHRRRLITGVTTAIVGVLFFIVYLRVDQIPESLVQSTPYIVTLVVLATASQRLRPPAHAGIPWRPGDNH